jgi:UDP-N-acetylmuramate dehydrogenase
MEIQETKLLVLAHMNSVQIDCEKLDTYSSFATMLVQKNISLKNFHTFGLDVYAAYFVTVSKLEDIIEIYQNTDFKNTSKLIIGGGSNVLFTKDKFEGLVIKNELYGKSILEENETNATIKVNSGENWHELVVWTIENNWGGIENLSLIPGTVGAAPMQNIGAYGVEIENSFVSLEALNLETLQVEKFSKESCAFGYRESIFKTKKKGQYFILNLVLKLQKNPKGVCDYGDIKKVLSIKNIEAENASIKQISDAIIDIRQSKLPDPKVLGNAGSFFKNPTIEKTLFNSIKQENPDLGGYETPDGKIKISAAWLIEKSGWKGKTQNNCGSHSKQALVLVNYGGAKGVDIVALSLAIQNDVKNKFGILLEPEVNIIY